MTAMCQCGHTRDSHQPDWSCFGCAGELPCDAPGVTVRCHEFSKTWRWDLRCEQHGTLRVGGDIDDWEPYAVTKFRSEHAACPTRPPHDAEMAAARDADRVARVQGEREAS